MAMGEIKNEELRIKNEELRIKNEELRNEVRRPKGKPIKN